MDATRSAEAPRCPWCGKDATRRLVLRPGRTTARRTLLAREVDVCDEHWRHFASQDEVGHTASDGDW